MSAVIKNTHDTNHAAETAAAKPVTAETNVFAVHGAEPETQAYAMAKYSRSSLSMQESLKEISSQKAEQFLNTFYFQYGHRSIADLAHIAMAIEKLSLLAAISVVDEQRWDGQERSTRYQNFKKSGYYTPDFGIDLESDALYKDTVDFLFAEYTAISEAMFQHLVAKIAKPEEMKQDAFERTMKARAFDISRYLLPLATNTSLGQIVNARTLETQISRLLTSRHLELRNLALMMKDAAQKPAYNPADESVRALVEEIAAANPELAERARSLLLKEVKVSPTLVKYTNPSEYEKATRGDLAQAAEEVMRDAPIAAAPLVDLLEDESLEIELATTLLYGACHYSYRQVRQHVEALSEVRRNEIIDLGFRNRGSHDELLRPLQAGSKFRFDILMDIGGFRDMHRHRRCVQVEQEFTTRHGYDIPDDIKAAGLLDRYEAVMYRTLTAQAMLAGRNIAEAAENSQYVIPLAFRKRTLFKMDFAEALYIAELRTTPAGHWSYRNVAYAMYEAVAARYPELARYFRVTDVRQPVDLLKR